MAAAVAAEFAPLSSKREGHMTQMVDKTWYGACNSMQAT